METGPLQYAKAFAGRWLSAMSGSASVPFAIAAVFVGEDWQKALAGGLAIVCLVSASYLVWKAERDRANALQARLDLVPLPPSADNWIDPREAYNLVCEHRGLNEESDPQGEARFVIFAELRQLASDGELAIRGRPNDGVSLFNAPREPIPAAHWRVFDFNEGAYVFNKDDVSQVSTEDTRIGSLASARKHLHAYYDLEIRRADIERLLKASRPKK